MMRHRARWIVVPMALAITVLAGCGDDSDPTDPTTVPPPGLANPASVFCEEQGGTVEIVDETDGQVGYCNLPDGSRIEEWEYFTAQTGSTTVP